jgi:hypothetical protein
LSFDVPDWPPHSYRSNDWPEPWLRFETEYPGSGRPSRLVSHTDAPYIVQVTNELPERKNLGAIASNYLEQLEAHLKTHGKSLDWPVGWDSDLVHRNAELSNLDLMHWLEVWPPVNSDKIVKSPQIRSWNLSRNENHTLPATIIMLATEFFDAQGDIAQFSAGFRVPMLVEPIDDGFRVIIRSMTAEYPNKLRKSWSTVTALAYLSDSAKRQSVLNALFGSLTSYPSDIRDQIGDSASVIPKSISMEKIHILSNVGENFVTEPIIIETHSKALESIARFPDPLSYLVVNKIEATEIDGPDSIRFDLKLLSTETYSMVKHVGQGEARVFDQTPPASLRPFDPAKPDAAYNWTLRRPTRTDDILDRFRKTVSLSGVSGGASMKLEDTGFRVRRCPEFVPQDKVGLGNPDPVKVVDLPTHKEIPPRRDEFSAISAYFNAMEFFKMLGGFGIDPIEFVARAETDIQVYYRYGITPGPGKDGRTVNAQVAYDCKEDSTTLPTVRMNLALAEMSRWDRPKNPAGERTWAQPLGIAADKRWMLHEFGHYLLAARIGKLEFDFSHSAGDAMAAIACDPLSRLADPRNGVAESFRGITYPFVFSTRRHDRSPSVGWAWYGELNRSVIEAPPSGCDDDLKGYLTEQILSSTLFRLYRALGGDSVDADAPDQYLRQRASFLTLYLLVRAIHALGQSPSRAEMLELGMEDVGRLQADVLEMVPALDLRGGLPQPDGWKGGLTHKVVRWTFESQGMFVEDPEATHNGMGKAPAVDIFIEDQRPLSEMVNGSRFTYGSGSYCPVSLDWGDAAHWFMSNPVVFGNRGSEVATQCKLRKWYGIVFNPDRNWGLTSQVFWVPHFAEEDLTDIAAGERRASRFVDTEASIAAATQEAEAEANPPLNSTAYRLVLHELTCPDDRANTDPAQDLAVAVGAATTVNLPMTPRALTDLVANDNNLGLRVIRFM